MISRYPSSIVSCFCTGECTGLGYCPRAHRDDRLDPRRIARTQAQDPTLWREPGSAQEAALQQELARLHAALGVRDA